MQSTPLGHPAGQHRADKNCHRSPRKLGVRESLSHLPASRYAAASACSIPCRSHRWALWRTHSPARCPWTLSRQNPAIPHRDPRHGRTCALAPAPAPKSIRWASQRRFHRRAKCVVRNVNSALLDRWNPGAPPALNHDGFGVAERNRDCWPLAIYGHARIRPAPIWLMMIPAGLRVFRWQRNTRECGWPRRRLDPRRRTRRAAIGSRRRQNID
jgi:hypothetical protein